MKKKTHSHLRALAAGGPVGLLFALRIARLQRREEKAITLMQREHERHSRAIAALRLDLNAAIDRRQAMTGAAARFWRAVKGQQ